MHVVLETNMRHQVDDSIFSSPFGRVADQPEAHHA